MAKLLLLLLDHGIAAVVAAAAVVVVCLDVLPQAVPRLEDLAAVLAVHTRVHVLQG